jgi:hypothetical protein
VMMAAKSKIKSIGTASYAISSTLCSWSESM